MKHISKEEFFNQLNSCKYGRQYLELVNNPENHLGKKDKGEVHHIHLRSLGGDNSEENLIKLSYFNHTLAHLLLAKASLEGNFIWMQPALSAITMMGMGRRTKLTELEKITLEELYEWSILRKIGYELTGKRNSEIWNSKTPKEQQEQINKWKHSYHSRTQEQKDKTSKKSSCAQKKRFEDPNERKKLQDSNYKRFEDPNEREKCNIYKNMTIEEYNQHCDKLRDTQLKRFEDPNEIQKYSDYSSNCRWVTNGDEEHFVQLEEINNYLNNDYTLGRLPQKNLSKNKKGSRWMSDGIDKGVFMEKDIQSKLDDGWYFCNRKGEPLKEKVKKTKEESNEQRSKTEKGRVLMTDGVCKPFWVIKDKQQDYIDINYYRCKRDKSPYIERHKKTKEELHIIQSNASRKGMTGSKLMTNGIESPIKVGLKKQQILFNKGWYFCDKKGNKKVI